jgi:hypothetical protein
VEVQQRSQGRWAALIVALREEWNLFEFHAGFNVLRWVVLNLQCLWRSGTG